MKTYAIGDIHGAFKALIQCLKRSGFDHKKDRLIVMGDVCDGYPFVKQCIDELLKIKQCDLVIGNHDKWALDWALLGKKPDVWTCQGGRRTMESYRGGPMPKAHIDFLSSGRLWIERGGQVFVHGGFDPVWPLSEQSAFSLMWDRTLLDRAWRAQTDGHQHAFSSYKEIFVGHTTSQLYKTLQPMHVCNVWNLDTGAGWSGKLTIMDVDSKEYWQSDPSPDLYRGTPDKL